MKNGIRTALCLLVILACVGCAATPSQQQSSTASQPAASVGQSASAVSTTDQSAAPVTSAASTTSEPVVLYVEYDDVRFAADNPIFQRVEELLNIKIEQTERNPTPEATMARMASGDLPDKIRDGQQVNVINNWIKQGLILPQDPALIKEKMPKYDEWIHSWVEGDPYVFGYRDGVNYWQPVIWSLGPSINAVAIRDDWMKNVGIETAPATLEEFETLLNAFTNEDPDQNGADDTYAITSVDTKYYVTSMAWGAFDVYPGLFYERDGEIVYGDIQPAARDALEVLNRWYTAGYIDPEYMVNKRENAIEKMVAGKIGIAEDSWYHFLPKEAFFDGLYYEALKAKVPDISFSILEPVKGAGGFSGMSQTNPNRGGVLYTTNLKGDQAKLEKYYEYYELISFDEEWLALTRWGEEGTTYKLDADGVMEWIPPYDQPAERDKYGMSAIQGTHFNEYELQKKFMTTPPYMAIREANEYKTYGEIDLLSQIERPEYGRLKPDLDAYVQKNIIDFITGNRPLGEFDAYVEEWYAMGGTAVMEEARAMYEEYYK